MVGIVSMLKGESFLLHDMSSRDLAWKTIGVLILSGSRGGWIVGSWSVILASSSESNRKVCNWSVISACEFIAPGLGERCESSPAIGCWESGEWRIPGLGECSTSPCCADVFIIGNALGFCRSRAGVRWSLWRSSWGFSLPWSCELGLCEGIMVSTSDLIPSLVVALSGLQSGCVISSWRAALGLSCKSTSDHEIRVWFLAWGSVAL